MLFVPRRQQQASKYPSQRTKPLCKFRIDKILRQYTDQAYETARLGRNGVHTTSDLVRRKMLAELEAAGDAMRYVNPRGQIAWKATPSLCQYLKDMELDAEADLADF